MVDVVLRCAGYRFLVKNVKALVTSQKNTILNISISVISYLFQYAPSYEPIP